MRGRGVWGAWLIFLAAALSYYAGAGRPMPAVAPAAAPAAPGAPGSYRAAPLRYLSTAPPDSLRLLPGIGPVLAARIVDARSGQGPFTSWDDLRIRVRGIGGKSVARLRHAAEPIADPVRMWTEEPDSERG